MFLTTYNCNIVTFIVIFIYLFIHLECHPLHVEIILLSLDFVLFYFSLLREANITG